MRVHDFHKNHSINRFNFNLVYNLTRSQPCFGYKSQLCADMEVIAIKTFDFNPLKRY